MPPATPPIEEALLRRCEPLGSLGPERLRELAALATREELAAGTVLFRAGDRDGRLWYLLAGEAELAWPDGRRTTVSAGAVCRPLADRQPRPATATAVTAIEVLRIDAATLELLQCWDELISAQIRRRAAHRASARDKAMAAIIHSRAFLAIPPANFEALATRFEEVAAAAGEVIVREGDAGDFYYLIGEGSAVIHAAGSPVVLAELGPGAAFGEEALASGAPRNATVTMTTRGQLWRLAKRDFDELLRAPLLSRLDRTEAAARVRTGRARWLDVRSPAEFAHARVSGAQPCPLRDLRELAATLDPQMEYICYCRTGQRSAAAAFLLAQRGFRAHVLAGGLQTLPAPAEESGAAARSEFRS